jgi:hypothetical protein
MINCADKGPRSKDKDRDVKKLPNREFLAAALIIFSFEGNQKEPNEFLLDNI